MKAFIGSKIVLAIAMTRLAYNEYRGWQLPSDENGEDAGYLVEYTDGGTPNHKDHAGYISWSPAEQFENGYVGFEVEPGLPAFQLRMAGELARLDSDLAKLRAFRMTPGFGNMNPHLQQMMNRQETAMSLYHDALNDRIDYIAAAQETL